jgi:HPt (histidine-containing phosphotransfer) domain-containing protein
MNESPHLDPAVLQRLQRLGDRAFVCKMIDLFLEYCEKKLGDARFAQRSGNLEGVEKAVHPLKSSAGNVGATRIRELAEQAEAQAREGHGPTLENLLAALEAEFAQVKPELEEIRRAFGGPGAAP